MRRSKLADEFEKVIIAAKGCSLTLLPELGGKVASLRADGHELMQQPLRPLARRATGMSFEASDASGWDECLPTVAACALETASGTVELADHGDLWRTAWRVTARETDAVTMVARCASLPLELTRSMMLAGTDRGWRLRVLYSLRNVGGERAPWCWAAHPLFACDGGDRVRLPESVKRVRVEFSRGERVGAAGEWIDWPRGQLRGVAYALDEAAEAATGWAEKLFTERLRDGWCEIDRLRIGLRLRVSFDVAATPYLGLWLCHGGWPEDGAARQMCLAAEPTTAPVDGLATMGEWSRWLEPGATTHWPMDVEIERMTAWA